MNSGLTAFGAVAGAASTLSGSFTVATITAPASGIAGVLGFTTTTAITIPIAAPIVIGAGLVAGGYMVHKKLKGNTGNSSP